MLLRKFLKWLHPIAEADPELEAALSRVDAASEELRATVEDASKRGVFRQLQEAVVRAAEEDEKRIRQRRYHH